MLEKNQRFKSLLYVLADAALLFIGFLLANYILSKSSFPASMLSPRFAGRKLKLRIILIR